MSFSIHNDGRVALSVVMATWNNARRLRVTLEALTACSVPAGIRWELVLVANNCDDDTAVVARSFGDRLPIVYLEESRQGLSHARNTGVRAARGSLIVFTDDDVTPCPEWMTVYWRAYTERPEGYYFGGRLIPEFEDAPPAPELAPFASLPVTGLDCGREPRVLREDERFLGANWACPGDALRRVGEFDPRLGLDASLGRHGSATGCRRHALVSADVGRRPFRSGAQVPPGLHRRGLGSARPLFRLEVRARHAVPAPARPPSPDRHGAERDGGRGAVACLLGRCAVRRPLHACERDALH
jgi:hypothetical protein